MEEPMELKPEQNEISIERFHFTGSGAEYFGIWIVNILLTILTLGIYSAWAKVRNKQYFYGNTILDESSFEYTAKPLQILKGRIVAVVILIIYNVLWTITPTIASVVLIVFVLAIPWVVMNSLAFNARYSEYRGINFAFQRNLFDAFKAILLYPILLLLVPIGLIVVSSVMSPIDTTSSSATSMIYAVLLPSLLAIASGLVAYEVMVYINTKYVVDNHSYGGKDFKLRLKGPKSFIRIYLEAIAIVIVPFVLLGAASSALISPDQLVQGEATDASTIVIMALVYIGFLFIYLFAFAYVNSRSYNLIYQNVSIHKHRLRAKTKPLDLVWLYFSNTLMIVLTLGLFIPWAKVRTARYLLEHTALQVSGKLNDFVATAKQEQGVWGEEIGEVFDLDVGI